MRVLVIDDDEMLRALATRILEGTHEVEVASSGEEGLHKVEGGAFDVVLCDLEMGGMSGLEVWRRLPEDLRRRFVLWTGAPHLVEGLPVAERPLTLRKPVPVEELESVVWFVGVNRGV